jgi:hypothetical protein
MSPGRVHPIREVYPAALNKEEVAALPGYEVSGGGFNNALGRLRTFDLVQGRGNSGPVTTCSSPRWPERFGQDHGEGQKNFNLVDILMMPRASR